ncbi:MAG: hypothetical protein HZT41_07175 [Dechloromonas sp.]|nr:MAG: hypothetical protein HZT41_07175 [Dechloromonas sp.]
MSKSVRDIVEAAYLAASRAGDAYWAEDRADAAYSAYAHHGDAAYAASAAGAAARGAFAAAAGVAAASDTVGGAAALAASFAARAADYAAAAADYDDYVVVGSVSSKYNFAADLEILKSAGPERLRTCRLWPAEDPSNQYESWRSYLARLAKLDRRLASLLQGIADGQARAEEVADWLEGWFERSQAGGDRADSGKPQIQRA